ncbi:MAG: hypothetical protein OQJ95_06550 [Kangiella sp.]|nr:hypothetical protein [Kangiella sp.]MCW9029241.1 hypothetical protein [Kangiella sp.]
MKDMNVTVNSPLKKAECKSWTLWFNLVALVTLIFDALNTYIQLFEPLFNEVFHYQIFVVVVAVVNYILRKYKTNSKLVKRNDC